jgi:predicted RNA-binding protein with PIN domain
MRGDDSRQALTDLEAALVAASKASEMLTAALERAAIALAADRQERPPVAVAPSKPDGPRADRRALRLPAGMGADSVEGASWMLTATRASVIVDGYDVAELGWASETPAMQREQLLEALDDLVCRIAAEIHVVFDGDASGPVRAAGRRQATVSFVPPDARVVEEIRARVQAVPATRPVIVVTDDAAVAHEAWADGANVLASRVFLAVAGHRVD